MQAATGMGPLLVDQRSSVTVSGWLALACIISIIVVRAHATPFVPLHVCVLLSPPVVHRGFVPGKWGVCSSHDLYPVAQLPPRSWVTIADAFCWRVTAIGAFRWRVTAADACCSKVTGPHQERVGRVSA